MFDWEPILNTKKEREIGRKGGRERGGKKGGRDGERKEGINAGRKLLYYE